MRLAREWVPFFWPAAWRDAATVDAIRGTPFNCAVGDDFAPAVREALNKIAVDVVSLKSAPATALPATVLNDARWPQVQRGSKGNIDAGPTGPPWIDSNGFAIQAARAVAPDKPVWVTHAAPAGRALTADD